MRRSTCVYWSLVVLSTCHLAAQTPPPTPAPDTAVKPSYIPGGLEFSGLVDGYYSLNFNHPASGVNGLRNFDVRADQFSLNFAKLAVEHAPDPVGFKLEFAAGKAMDIFHATEPGSAEIYRRLLQAYVSVKPAKWKGLQLDFGKFVTSAGAEVTETHLNWNYSRSLLYANGPYYHFGLRTTMPITSKFTAGVQVINGWNNIEENNSAKTVGFTAALTTSKISWFNNYYVGNEKPNKLNGVRIEAPGLRHFYDTVVSINGSGRLSGLFNFDYGVDRTPGGRDNVFYGTSVATRLQVTKLFAVSPRYDWYKDRDGFITASPQTIQEFTMTGDWKWVEGLITRLEFRRDWSNVPFFDRGNERSNARAQNTILLGVVAYFGPKR